MRLQMIAENWIMRFPWSSAYNVYSTQNAVTLAVIRVGLERGGGGGGYGS